MVAMKNSYRLIFSAFFLAVLFASTAAPIIPLTGMQTREQISNQAGTIAASTATIVNLDGTYQYGVIQQPKGKAGFVSTETDKLTQFSLAGKYGSQGFLAHNYLAGAAFFDLEVGSLITIVYADGHLVNYEVQAVRRFQAIMPTSATTNFLDLDNNNAKLSTKQVFMQTYGLKDHLILQTCIANEKELSWGRLFIIATPVE